MTRILSILSVDYISNSYYVQLAKRFGIISNVLIKHGLRQTGWELRPAGHEDEFWLQVGFVFDFESTPNIIRGPLGENKRGGASHDGACRKFAFVYWPATLTAEELKDPKIQASFALITDPAPEGITKSIAADVYFEIMAYCDIINYKAADHYTVTKPWFKLRDWSRRWLKSTVVRVWPGDFFQKYEMTATSEEMYGLVGDPYATIDKLEEAIVQSKEATEAIKEVPEQVAEKPAMVAASEKVTSDLKDVKTEIEKKEK